MWARLQMLRQLMQDERTDQQADIAVSTYAATTHDPSFPRSIAVGGRL